MDVKKTKVKRESALNKKKTLLIAAATLFVGLVSYAVVMPSGKNVERKDILISTVKQGELDVIVDGYGVLTSHKQQLITTLTSATVKEILLRPGAQVNHDSVIARLENPELVQQVESDKRELESMKANLRQLKLTHKRELLQESADLMALESQHKLAKLNRIAEEKLIESGIVSKLTFQKSVLEEEELTEKLKIFQKHSEQLLEVHSEAVRVEIARIQQYEGQLAISQRRLDELTVRAGFDGVLQRLHVELGQSLSPGEKIALIGSSSDLIAMIKVPQSQIDMVELGQKTLIDTRTDVVEGVVARIDPEVTDNTVSVEIKLPNQLPRSARPQSKVDGQIIIARLENVRYLERPANVRSDTLAQLYLLDKDMKSAELNTIQFGRQAGRYIEVLSGAEVNDQLIVSDLSSLARANSYIKISS